MFTAKFEVRKCVHVYGIALNALSCTAKWRATRLRIDNPVEIELYYKGQFTEHLVKEFM